MSARKNGNVNSETGEVKDEVALYQEPQLDRQALNGIDTSEQALNDLVASWGLNPDDLIIGDVYRFVEDKDDLIGVPLVLVQWQFGLSESYLSDYVQVKAVRMDTNEKIGIFDSGLGIYGYLSELTEKRLKEGKAAYNGAVAPKGLTVSEYGPKLDDAGNMIRPGGKTYYFA